MSSISESPLNETETLDLTEKELRELYENEEIDRFLSLFSTYVTEAQSTEAHLDEEARTEQDNAHNVTQPTFDDNVSDDSTGSPPFVDQSLLTLAVNSLLIPNLPHTRLPPPEFTLGGLRLTIERLFITMDPVYIPFLTGMVHLATWKNRKISCFYCSVYWILWYYNVLLPALLLRVLYAVFQRKIFQHPTLSELQDHRRQIIRATELGNELSDRLAASSSLDLKELWRLLKIVNKTTKQQLKHSAKAKITQLDGKFQPEHSTLDWNSGDLKRIGLHFLHEIADFHERIKNIMLWRRPASSWFYGVMIFCGLLVTLVVPAKYLSKLGYFIGGFLFWHVTPVIASIPYEERFRLPPLFGDVPTDADYAMDLISRRLALGLSISPTPKARKLGKHSQPREKNPSPRNLESSSHSRTDWKKWGDRAALGRIWINDGKRLIKKGQTTSPVPSPGNISSSSITESKRSAENLTYPAQHASGPGLITLMRNELLFTPIMSLEPKIIIPFAQIRSVKKAGLLKGLVVCASDGGSEEKFRWVGGRDELFARLVGADGRRWMMT